MGIDRLGEKGGWGWGGDEGGGCCCLGASFVLIEGRKLVGTGRCRMYKTGGVGSRGICLCLKLFLEAGSESFGRGEFTYPALCIIVYACLTRFFGRLVRYLVLVLVEIVWRGVHVWFVECACIYVCSRSIVSSICTPEGPRLSELELELELLSSWGLFTQDTYSC